MEHLQTAPRAVASSYLDEPPEVVVPGELEAQWVNPEAVEKWDDQVRAHDAATVFHGRTWARVLTRTYGHQPHYLQVLRGDWIVALVPIMEVTSPVTGKRGVSLPFSDFSEPLFCDDEALEFALDHIQQRAAERNWDHVELRGAEIPGASASETYCEHRLRLDEDFGKVEQGFAKSVQRAIRKAEKNGIQVRVQTDREAMEHYYRLHVHTRRRHGLPPQSWAFFRNLHEEVIGEGQGFIVLAYHNDRPIAGAVFLTFGENAVYKYGASHSSHWELRPNNLVMREAIRHLCEQGLQTLSFGRTDAHDEGLRRFKQGWGTEETTVSYYKYFPATQEWGSSHEDAESRLKPGGLIKSVFQRMPLTINRIIGAALYPHLD